MKVLVTGGAGYIGGTVVDELRATGHHVVCYDSLVYEDVYRKPVDFCWGDILDIAKLGPWLEWSDAVVWLAAMVGDPVCAAHPALAGLVNVTSLDALKGYGGRVVFASTCSVYGKSDGIITEAGERAPVSVYGHNKVRGEDILTEHADAVVFRLGTLHGLSDDFGRIRTDLAINVMSAKAVRDGSITVFGGRQWRPFLHVRDAAKAMAWAVEDVCPPGVYNLVQENMQIRDMAELIGEQVPECETVNTATGADESDARDYRADGSLWGSLSHAPQPTVTVSQGITEVAALVRSGRLRRPFAARFINSLSYEGTASLCM